MPKENSIIYLPYHLYDGTGALQTDTDVSHYHLAVYKDGVLFTPATGFVIISASAGRHLLTFQAGAEGQYSTFIDYTHIAGWSVSVPEAWINVDKWLSSEMPLVTAADTWDAPVADHLGMGAAGAYLNRILQFAAPDVLIDPVHNLVTLKDNATGAVLAVYHITGTIDTRIGRMDI